MYKLWSPSFSTERVNALKTTMQLVMLSLAGPTARQGSSLNSFS